MPPQRGGGHWSIKPFKLDMLQWVKILELFNGRGVMLNKREVHTEFFSVDASLLQGMGGFLDGRFFSVSWKELATWKQKPWYPFQSKETSNINYLELFAIWYALHLWGKHLVGLTIVVWSDNVTAEIYARNLWGLGPYIPLLKQIWYILVDYDIRLVTTRIDTKSNILSDALSRGAWEVFAQSVGLGKAWAKALSNNNKQALARLQALWHQKKFSVTDFDDWMLVDQYFYPLADEFGPFTLDGATDLYRSNSRCRRSVNKIDDGTKYEYGGFNTYCNPPYSIIILFLLQFLRCKQKSPVGTSALFILPAWTNYEFYKLMLALPQIFQIKHRYPMGVNLFSSPNNPTINRMIVGPTKWPVVAVWIPPTHIHFELDWGEWETRANIDLARAGIHR